MRYHPLTIAFRIYQLVKNSFLFAIILFVLNRDSTSWIFVYGRYAFVALVTWRFIYLVSVWFFEKYEWKDRTFHIHKGIFVKHTSTIPFSKIQNVTRKTTVFHKLVGLTSLTFETAMDGDDDAIHFEVLTKEHANFLLDLVQPGKTSISQKENADTEVEQLPQQEEPEQERIQETNRTVHFTPKRKDLWKASFTSLSFLAIIPIAAGILENLEPLLPEEDQVKGMFQGLLEHKWFLFGIIFLAVIVAVGFGVTRTFIRYGKYKISSDATHIYIDRGVLAESHFAIEKRKIQGLEMTQSLMKRLFGLAEVKLISSASPKNGEGEVNVNSLYPFLPVNRAYQLVEELLPTYQVNTELERLPRKSLWVKLLQPSWLWVIVTTALVYFKPAVFQLEQVWWVASLVLLCLILLHRILDYIQTRYVVTEDQVQWWNGGLTTRMFMTKRKNVIEMSYSQTRLQGFFKVASVTTKNRSTPVHIEEIHDIPLPFAVAISDWYRKRLEDVELVKND